jgi:hypothetical protein
MRFAAIGVVAVLGACSGMRSEASLRDPGRALECVMVQEQLWQCVDPLVSSGQAVGVARPPSVESKAWMQALSSQ